MDYDLTVTNNYDCAATLSFDWAVDGFQKYGGESVSKIGTSGSEQVKVSAGAEPAHTITVQARLEAGIKKTSILTLTNITLTPEVQNGKCMLQFDAERSSVAVNGEAAANDSKWTADAATGLSLKAEAKEGYRFLGWVDQADGAVLSSEESFAFQSGGEVIVSAVFAKEGEEIWFGVADLGSSGGLASGHTSHVNAPVFLFDDLAQATACAASSGYSYIVLLNGGVLPAGSYTIPKRVTLLIPFDDERTIYLASPA